MRVAFLYVGVLVVLPLAVLLFLGYHFFHKENEEGRTLVEARVWDAHLRKYFKGDGNRTARTCREDLLFEIFLEVGVAFNILKSEIL